MTTYLANLDFDDRLGGRAGGAQPRPGPPDENAMLWRLVTEPGDVIVVPGLTEPLDAPAHGPLPAVCFRPPNWTGEPELVPWGIDELAQRLCPTTFLQEAVALSRRINDRLFAHELDPLPGSTFCTDADHVLARAARGERLMLKPRHGGFGRRLRRVLGRESDANLQGWVRSRCREGGLIVEPLVERVVAEWGVHWTIRFSSTGITKAEYDGVTALRCDAHGQFVSSVASTSESPLQDCSECLPPSLTEMGYVGPLTVDQWVREHNGEHVTDPIRDINARWSVGRLVLRLRQRLGAEHVSIRRVVERTRSKGGRAPTDVVLPSLIAGQKPRWLLSVG